MSEIELCCECNQPTGRAGKADDSLYANSFGPYCTDCWYDAPHALADTIAAQAAEIERLREALGRCIQWMDPREKKAPGLPRVTDYARAALSDGDDNASHL